MKKEIEAKSPCDPWDDLTEERQQNYLLYQMYESAYCGLARIRDDAPEDREVFDYLFKGKRRYKDVRRLEEHLRAVVLEEKLHFLKWYVLSEQ